MDDSDRATRAAAARRMPPLAGTVAVTVVSRSHLPFARVLARSLAAVEPALPLRAVVADLEPGEAVELPGVEVVAATEVGAAPFRWLALQHTPTDLCCAIKPFAVEHALACGAGRVVYLDSDVQVLGPLTALLAPLERAEWVVVPHQRRPFPADEPPGGIPSQDDLDRCGELNAGVFAVRAGARAREFLAGWCAAMAEPGAFLDGWRGGRTEQQLFARVLEPRWAAHRLADPGHDVAYWNLHERPLEERDGTLLAGGAPLATFHWSGFDPVDPSRLSRYDSRHPLGRGGALDRLATRYRAALVEAGWPGERVPWRWDRLPSGAPIDHRVRPLVRRFERELDAGDDPWSPAGERRLARALLATRVETGTLLPLLFEPVWRERSDLREEFPEAPAAPDRYLAWIEAHGAREHGYETWLALAREGHGSPFERPALDRARALWRGRPDLRRAFPRPLGADAGAFGAWLASFGREEHGAAADCAPALARAVGGGGLSRAARWLAERRGATAGEVLAAASELGAEAAIAALWLLDGAAGEGPWAG